MLLMKQAPQFASAMKLIKWQRRTAPSPIIVCKRFFWMYYKGNGKEWPVSIRSRNTEILALLPTLTLVKQQPPSVLCSILARLIVSVLLMMVQQLLIGWSRNVNAALRLYRPLFLLNGRDTSLT